MVGQTGDIQYLRVLGFFVLPTSELIVGTKYIFSTAL